MLGMLALMAVTMAGADESTCARHVEEAAIEEMIAEADAEFIAAAVYAEAEADFDAVLEEAGLAGSTLGREEARAIASQSVAATFARNR